MGAGGVPSETWRPKGAPWTCGRESIGGGGDTQDKSQSRGCAGEGLALPRLFYFIGGRCGHGGQSLAAGGEQAVGAGRKLSGCGGSWE